MVPPSSRWALLAHSLASRPHHLQWESGSCFLSPFSFHIRTTAFGCGHLPASVHQCSWNVQEKKWSAHEFGWFPWSSWGCVVQIAHHKQHQVWLWEHRHFPFGHRLASKKQGKACSITLTNLDHFESLCRRMTKDLTPRQILIRCDYLDLAIKKDQDDDQDRSEPKLDDIPFQAHLFLLHPCLT